MFFTALNAIKTFVGYWQIWMKEKSKTCFGSRWLDNCYDFHIIDYSRAGFFFILPPLLSGTSSLNTAINNWHALCVHLILHPLLLRKLRVRCVVQPLDVIITGKTHCNLLIVGFLKLGVTLQHSSISLSRG